MKKIIFTLLTFTLLVSWYSCQYKKESIAYPSTTCDTSNVKYSTDIVNILRTNCYECHANNVAATLGQNNKLEGYNNLSFYAQSGYLLNVVNHDPGADPMPKNRPKIAACDIAKIRTWLRNGYPNN